VTDRTPAGAEPESIEAFLLQVGEVREHADGVTFVLTPEMIQDYAEWVAASEREAIAQALESMPKHVTAAQAAGFVRRVRGEH
jgi:hypothetical protein